ncbi:hypothetical protein [Rugosimonospora africana]|uniref:Uncharacterized protein n=1 Tax=Rugosimonospora africana TaxID=556532 RepID=A0A8J3QYS2_9ACTN|nr:hypothetical protein [Rugosimonospora africana]GIH19006.1 hypothetical protein Raf01_71780 [Rugosimonospora africana]
MALEYRIAIRLAESWLPAPRSRSIDNDSLAVCRRVANGQPVNLKDALAATSAASSAWFWTAVACLVAAIVVEIPLSFIANGHLWNLAPSLALLVGAAIGFLEFTAMTTRARYFRWRQLRSGAKRAVLSGRFDFWIALVAGVLIGGSLSLVGLANA